MKYRVQLAATSDGRGVFGIVCRWNSAYGRWSDYTSTRNYRTYPQSVRAIEEAESIIKRHAKLYGIKNIEIVRD